MRVAGGWPVRYAGRATFAAAAALTVAACGLEAPQGPPRAGDPLPEMTAVDLQGREVRLADYEGRAVLLNLWATWCPPCRAEMPYLQELQDRFGDQGLSVVGISVDDSGARRQLDQFLAESGVEYDILLDPDMDSMDLLGVLGLPATLLVDAEGVVKLFRTGPISEEDQRFVDAVRALLPGADG
ncbi:MAG TPA: TlpA disulfide reductase family protein [Longimicrobiales bacterium]|nr:TlpA disulfide reductase family protein [Longimicrobiales bacterium]